MMLAAALVLTPGVAHAAATSYTCTAVAVPGVPQTLSSHFTLQIDSSNQSVVDFWGGRIPYETIGNGAGLEWSNPMLGLNAAFDVNSGELDYSKPTGLVGQYSCKPTP
ncbi:MAG: hypothetical protein ACREMP_09645 [Candidatus Tyrphobacter sp.]